MDNENVQDPFEEHLESLNSGYYQPLVENYVANMENAIAKKGGRDQFDEGFGVLKTDFNRVCYFLEALEESNPKKKGIAVLGLPLTQDEVRKTNGKSDALAERFIERAKQFWEERSVYKALNSVTFAVFYAHSDRTKAMAFNSRAGYLHALKLFDECIRDMAESIKLLSSEEFEQLSSPAAGSSESVDILSSRFKKLTYADKSQEESSRRMREDFFIQSLQRELGRTTEWKCFRREPPEDFSSSDIVFNLKKRSSGNRLTECRLTSANDGILRLKYRDPQSGWTLEVTRDVSVGEVLLTETPYASVVMFPRTAYCYHCLKRCHNLLPCNGCAQVGFCSTVCERKAKDPEDTAPLGPGRHTFDCGGLIPCFRLDTVDEDEEHSTDEIYYNELGLTHLAFSCIANTSPKTLIDYICSTGKYKKSKGHQAFVGSEAVRRAPPKKFDPSDYASIAWLCSNSDKFHRNQLWNYTFVAVFLTYCLSIAGYPMKWFHETKKLFYTMPSSASRPDHLPASWVAACILYHLQSIKFNAISYAERIEESHIWTSSHFKRFGVALSPTISLINHACVPSTDIEPISGGKHFIYALRFLPAGSEISLSYTTPYYDWPTSQRQAVLSGFHLMTCSCDACRNDWSGKSNASDILKCVNCRKSFISTKNRCPHCRDGDTVQIYQILKELELPILSNCITSGEWTSEKLKSASGLLEQMDSIMSLPGKTFEDGIKLYECLIGRIKGNWTIEPWKNLRE